MEETKNVITKIVEDYNKSDNHNPVGLLDMARTLSSNLFFLEKHRSDAKKRWNEMVKDLRYNHAYKVNAAQNEADVQIPELYELRRFMESAYEVLWTMKSELSWLKAEMNNTNIRG